MTNDELERLVQIAHQEVMHFFEPDCCVLATRLLINVLDAEGVRAFPLSVIAAFYGQRLAEHVDAHGCEFWSCTEKLDLNETAVILGMPPGQRGPDTGPENPLRAHVAAIVMLDTQLMLVDLTVEQASHPELGLPIEGYIVAPVEPLFIIGWSQLVAKAESNVHLRYVGMPQDKWYATNSPDWNMHTTIHDEIERAIRDRYHGREAQYSMQTQVVASLLGRV